MSRAVQYRTHFSEPESPPSMARSLDVTLLDSDLRGRETLGYALEGEAFRVAAFSDVREALVPISANRPAVILVVIRESIDHGLDQLNALRSHPATQGIPVLAIGPTPLRPEVQSLGTIDFLPLPCFVRDTLTACRLLGSTATGPDGTEVHGSLSDFGFFFVVRTMMGLGRSGVVTLARANRQGEVRFLGGEVVSAVVGSLQGQPALHQLLLWDEAALEIKFKTVARRGQSFKKGDELLDETERFLRDFTHATKDLGTVSSLFVQEPAQAAAEANAIAPEILPVLRLFDGHRTLGDVLEDSPFRVFDTLRIVSRLAETAVIRRKAIEKPSVGDQRKPPLEKWLGREGDNLAMVEAVRPTLAPVPVSTPAGDQDQRNSGGNRRKVPRKAKPQVQISKATPPSPVPPPEARAPIVMTTEAPFAATPSALTRSPLLERPAGGEITARGEMRASARVMPIVSDSPSVVLDFSSDELTTTPAPVATPFSRQSGVHTAELTTSTRLAIPTPSRSHTADSIQIDPSLVSELDAIEMANSPKTPPPVLVAAAVPAPRNTPPGPVAALLTPSPVAPPPTAPLAPTRSAQKAAGEFNDLEHDFFAREADIYKSEAAETFDDLDPAHRRPPR